MVYPRFTLVWWNTVFVTPALQCCSVFYISLGDIKVRNHARRPEECLAPLCALLVFCSLGRHLFYSKVTHNGRSQENMPWRDLVSYVFH